MKINFHRLFRTQSCLLALVILFLSCKRDEPIYLAPSITFKKTHGYTYQDSTISFGKLLKIGIIAVKGQNNLTNLIIQMDTGRLVTSLDTSFNTDYIELDHFIRKSQASEENWIFKIRDKKGNSATVKLRLTRDLQNSFDSIVTKSNVVLNGRHHPNPKSFLSLFNYLTYTLAEAFNNQGIIDIFYYFGTDMHTLASPGASVEPDVFSGATPVYKFENWNVRNTTRYKDFPLSKEDFDNIRNDSLLFIAYGTEEGKRKAQELAAGHVISFSTANNRLGLLRIKEVSGHDSGYIKFDLKFQK